MQSLLRSALMVSLAGCLAACSRQAPPNGGTASVQASSPSAAAPTAPADSPCALLTDVEVRGVFAQAEPGKRNTEGLQYGLDRCAWETPTGQVGVEVSKVEAAAFENELRGELAGVVDPRIEGAADQIRLQRVPGIGDHAIAVLEKADAQRGILADIALLAIQRGDRMAVLIVHEASSNAPLPALDKLEGLGRKLTPRL